MGQEQCYWTRYHAEPGEYTGPSQNVSFYTCSSPVHWQLWKLFNTNEQSQKYPRISKILTIADILFSICCHFLSPYFPIKVIIHIVSSRCSSLSSIGWICLPTPFRLGRGLCILLGAFLTDH